MSEILFARIRELEEELAEAMHFASYAVNKDLHETVARCEAVYTKIAASKHRTCNCAELLGEALEAPHCADKD